jgi:drug/metabolite transporter (DMT)-like permease
MTSTENNVQAILWVLLSTAVFTVVFAAAKFADGAIGTFQILWLRYIGGFLTLSVLVARAGSLHHFKSKASHLHFLRALFGCSAAAAITWATGRMPVADASAIGILYGVITVLLGIFFLKEVVSTRHWLAVLVSFVGAAIVIGGQGAFQSVVTVWPVVVALLSAVLMASEGLLIRVLSQTEDALTMMLYVTGFGILLMALPAFLEWRTIDTKILVGCLALGPLSVVAQYCTIRGYRMAPLSVVGPVDYSWLIFAMILGFVAFGEQPSAGVLVGGTFIIVGGILLSRTRR